jgi:type III restriction enzyme
VATGEEKKAEAIDAKYAKGIADEACPVKYVITQKALAEGWDCPSAYILVSMATLHSSTSVEQLLGRILRQPDAKHREHAALNQSYAFVASRDFAETAAALRDRLVEGAGFDRKAAAEFVTAARPDQGRMDYNAHPDRIVIRPVVVELSEKPNMRALPKALKEKVSEDRKS